MSWYQHFHLRKIFRDTCEYMHNSPTTRSKVERRECGSARAVIMHSSGYYTHPFRSRGEKEAKGRQFEGVSENHRERIRNASHRKRVVAVKDTSFTAN